MSLPLPLRKDLRDNEPSKVELLKRIDAATGVTGWSFDADIAALHTSDKIDKNFKERVGEGLFGKSSYLKTLADRIDAEMKDAMVKEQFVQDCSAKKITFKLWDGCERASEPEIHYVDGVLEIRQKTFPCNVQDTGKDLRKRLGQAAGGLSLALRQNIRNSVPEQAKHLARISKATGGAPWTFEVDYAKLVPDCGDKNFKDRIADALVGKGSFLSSLAEGIEKVCADDMVKEAINESASKHKITFVYGETERASEPEVHYKDGVLQIKQRATAFPANVASVRSEKEIQKRL